MYAGVLEEKEASPNISLIQKMMPGVTEIIFVGDDSATNRAIQKQCQKTMQDEFPELSWHFISGERLSDVTSQLAQYSEGVIVLTTIGGLKGEHGEVVSLDHILQEIREKSGLEIFSMEDAYLLGDVIGGYVTSGLRQGMLAGQMAATYLAKDVDFSELGIVEKSPNEFMFNWEALQRTGLALPEQIRRESTIINQPFSFYREYKPQILFFIGIVSLLIVVVIALFVNVIRRTRAEESLALSEQRYALAVTGSSDGIWDWIDVNSDRQWWSRRCYEVAGYEQGEIEATGSNWIGLVHPEDRGRVQAAMQSHLENGTPFDCEYRTIRKSGDFIWTRSRGQALWDAEGKPVRVVGIVQDIHHKKIIENALRFVAERTWEEEGKKFLDSLVAYLATALNVEYAIVSGLQDEKEGTVKTVALWALGEKGDNIEYKREGAPCNEVAGKEACCYPKGVQQLFPEDHLLVEMEAEAYAGVPLWESKGAPLGLIAVIGKKPFADTDGVLSILKAVAPKVAHELERLQNDREKKHLVEAIDQVAESIMIIDLDGKIRYVNPAFEKVTGYSYDEAVGNITKIAKTEKQDENFYHEIWEDISHGKIWRGNLLTNRKDGSTVEEECTISPVKDETGKTINYVVVKRDITEERQLQAQLSEAQKMEALGTLAGGIAHDFNNILTAIIGYSELSLLEAPPESRMQRNLQAVIGAGDRATKLIARILAFSRQTDQKLKPVLLMPVFEEVVKLLQASLPTTIDIQGDFQSDAIVLADPTQIHQVLMNLCTNAGLAMRDCGGVLRIGLTEQDVDATLSRQLQNIKPGPYLKISVSDTGCGVSPEIKDRIFEPFFTTREKGEGTGLGLSVVHGVVKSHNGKIVLESELGKGTVFTIYLPIEMKKSQATSSEQETLHKGTERILFVDDEAFQMDLAKQLLQQLGYHVTCKNDSLEALEVYKANQNSFDLVITDMTMPNISGYELSKKLLSIRPDLPIILCTGFSDTIDEQKAEAIGVKGFIMKPYKINTLAKKIRDALS
jgi:PAS domain S-box-containing protein